MSTVRERRLVAIVDDEKAVCRAIGRLVISAGFESETFSSAEEFLRSCREHRPDCLILDLRLPGMSEEGLLTLRQPGRIGHCSGSQETEIFPRLSGSQVHRNSADIDSLILAHKCSFERGALDC